MILRSSRMLCFSLFALLITTPVRANIYSYDEPATPINRQAQASSASRERATDEEMAEEALVPYLPRVKGAGRETAIQALHTRLGASVVEKPSQETFATVILPSGSSVEHLSALAERYDLKVASFQLKAPLNDKGVVQTIWIGPHSLHKFHGDFSHRATKAIGITRSEFYERSLSATDTALKDRYETLAQADFKIYSFDAIGVYADFGRLSSSSDVKLVVPTWDEYRASEEIASFESVRRESEKAWSKRIGREVLIRD